MSGSTNFPSSLDSHTSASPLGFGQVNNLAYTLTTTTHTNSVTTVTVADTSLFPSKGYIVVRREVISYTGTTATTFTGCTRGVGGTTAAAFPSGTLVEQVPVAANHNDLAAGLVAVQTQMGAYLGYLPRKNRVINGDMRVAQRTTFGSTDDTFTLDRWTLLLEAASAAAVTQETSDVPTDGSQYALKMTVGSGEDNKFGVATYLEYRDVASLRGKTVSLQAKLKATAAITDVRMAVLEWTSTADSVTSDVVGTWGSAGTNPTLATNWTYLGTPANLSPTTSWATYRVEGLTVGASANNLAIFVWCEDETTTATTDYLLVTDVQLEEGPNCSGVERRPYVQELQMCQRYFEAAGGSGGSFDCFGLGSWVTTTNVRVVFYFQSRKRTTPSVSTSAVSDLKVTYLTSWAGDIALSALSVANGGVTAVCLSADVGSAVGTAGQTSLMFANSTTAARVFFSAEL